MTKLTKNEKILRKGNEKWKNFLAEGAFKKALNESFDFKTSHFADRMKPEELELLNIPEEEYKTKSKEEVEAIAAALDKAHEQSQYGVVLRSTATYAENEPILRLIDKKRKATRAITGEKGYYISSGPEEDEEYRMTYSNDMPSRSGEVDEGMGGETGADWDDLLSQIMNASPDADAAKMAERAADLVDAGNIDAATDLIADIINNTSDPDTSETAEKAYDAVEALQMNEARMGEYGKMDAEQGLPPTKIGRGNEEYMAAYNAVLQARGEEPLDIQKPDQAYLDALRSGQLEESMQAEMNLQNKAKGKAMSLLQTAKAMAQAPSHEPARGYAAAVAKAAGEIVDLMVELEGFLYMKDKDGQLEEQEDPKLAFPLSHSAPEVKSLEQGYKKMKDFHNKFPSDKTDKVLSYFLNLMAAIKRAEESLYIDEKKNLKEEVSKRVAELLSEGLTPEQVQEKILEEGIGDFLRKGADFVKAKTGLGRTTKTRELYSKMKFEKDKYFEFRDKFYPDATDVRNFMEFVEQNARKQGGGRGGMMSDLAYRAISREKFKTMDSPITYLKQARKLANNIEKMMLDGAVDQKGDKTFKVIRSMAESIMKDFEQARAYLKELRVAIKRAQKSGDAQALKDIYRDQVEHERYLSQSQARADKAFAAKAKEAERKARKDKPKDDEDMIRGKSTQRFGMATNLEENEKKNLKETLPPHLAKFFDDKGNLTPDAEERLKKAREKDPKAKIKDVTPKGYGPKNEEVIEDFEIELEGGITFADVEEAGLVTPGVDSVIDNGDGYAQVYSEPGAMAKMARTLEAMTGVMVSPKSHGPVDERSKDDERDLEKPVKYGSGAELEFDKKAQKFYDRKRDMYIDDPEEEDNLIKEKDEKEFAKVKAIATDMMVLSARSRIKPTLGSVQSALDVQKIPSQMEGNKLIVADKYVVAEKDVLPETAESLSFTRYAIDYLSNLPGEQQELPLG